MVRHAGRTEATVWLEADAPCAVAVLGREERTFAVGGRHFAVVPLEGLAPGVGERYEVRLDGVRRWPPPGGAFPPSVVRPLPAGPRLRLLVGSCRVAAPERPPWTASPDEHRRGLGPGPLRALARPRRVGHRRVLVLPAPGEPDPGRAAGRSAAGRGPGRPGRIARPCRRGVRDRARRRPAVLVRTGAGAGAAGGAGRALATG